MSSNSSPRRIAVVTGTRAEYGLLRPLLTHLKAAPDIALQLLVTGAHLSPHFGNTVSSIERDGFVINGRLDLDIAPNATPLEISHYTARALEKCAEAFCTLRPEMVVVLGDRYEIFAAASAAALLNIPIAHIHGGEVTEGAIDERLRHAITKLAYWHFASTQVYAKRIVQLGEDTSRIYVYGAPGLDILRTLPVIPSSELGSILETELKKPLLLVTYHPETLQNDDSLSQIEQLLSALDHFSETASIVISGANADAGGSIINRRLSEYAEVHKNVTFRLSYGSDIYINLLRQCDLVVGNSSSGVIEAAALGKACVNIGDRQKGRLRADTVIDCAADTAAILAAITKGLSSEFQKKVMPSTMFGEPGDISRQIADTLRTVDIPKSTAKAFHDLKDHAAF